MKMKRKEHISDLRHGERSGRKVSVVVCTLNREDELKDCIDSIRNQSRKPDEIILVSMEKLAIPGTRTIIQKGRGLPNARNLSLGEVSGDILIFFDDDTILDRDYIKSVLKAFDGPDVGGVTGRLENPPEQAIKKGILGKITGFYARLFGFSGFFVTTPGIGRVLSTGFISTNFDQVCSVTEVQCMSGCNMAYSRSALSRTGKFDEDLIGNAYYEDADYSFRVHKNGFRLLAIPEARIKHLLTPTSREALSRLKYYQLFNQKTFFRKQVHSGSPVQLIRHRFAHLSLLLPVLAYSVYFKNLALLKSFIRVEMSL